MKTTNMVFMPEMPGDSISLHLFLVSFMQTVFSVHPSNTRLGTEEERYPYLSLLS